MAITDIQQMPHLLAISPPPPMYEDGDDEIESPRKSNVYSPPPINEEQLQHDDDDNVQNDAVSCISDQLQSEKMAPNPIPSKKSRSTFREKAYIRLYHRNLASKLRYYFRYWHNDHVASKQRCEGINLSYFIDN